MQKLRFQWAFKNFEKCDLAVTEFSDSPRFLKRSYVQTKLETSTVRQTRISRSGWNENVECTFKEPIKIYNANSMQFFVSSDVIFDGLVQHIKIKVNLQSFVLQILKSFSNLAFKYIRFI